MIRAKKSSRKKGQINHVAEPFWLEKQFWIGTESDYTLEEEPKSPCLPLPLKLPNLRNLGKGFSIGFQIFD